jgi:flagellar biosynthesis chaperone FliJ
MFFRIIIFSALFVSVSFADDFKGCGEDEDKARKELSNSIHVTVKTGFQKLASTIGNKVGLDETRFFSNQETNLELSGIERSEEDGKICFSISKEKLKENGETLLTEVSALSVGNKDELIEKCKRGISIAKALGNNDLIKQFTEKMAQFTKEESQFSFAQIKSKIENFIIPNDENEAFKKLKLMISDLEKNLSETTDKQHVEYLEEQKSKLQILLGKLKLQSTVFHIEGGTGLKIMVDSNEEVYSNGKKIPLEVGKHSYTIESDKHCPISGTFELQELEKLEISDIDLSEYAYPRISFSSNKADNVEIVLDGDDIALNKEKVIEKCDGVISYRATFNDGEFQDQEGGDIAIEAGMDKDIFLKFISTGELKAIKNEMSAYTNGERLEFLASYSSTTDKEQYNGDFNSETMNFEINHITHKRLFRYGYGFMWGTEDFDKKEVQLTELYYIFGFHLATFGKSELPLRIGKTFSFIPHAGIKFGLAYHQYKMNDERFWKFPTEENSNEEDGDDWKFSRDTLLLKPFIGVDFIISKGFAIKVFAEQSIYQDKRFQIGTGLSIEF